MGAIEEQCESTSASTDHLPHLLTCPWRATCFHAGTGPDSCYNNAMPLDSNPVYAYVFAGVVSVLFISVATIGAIAFYRTQKGGAKTFTLLFERADALRVLTVGVIVIGTVLLGFARGLDSTAVATILSGISGFVLGGVRKSEPGLKKIPKSNDTDSKPQTG